jgi:hypothetical protein
MTACSLGGERSGKVRRTTINRSPVRLNPFVAQGIRVGYFLRNPSETGDTTKPRAHISVTDVFFGSEGSLPRLSSRSAR